jgi:hypothetical protein
MASVAGTDPAGDHQRVDDEAASRYIDAMSRTRGGEALAAATGSTDPEVGLRAVAALRGLLEVVEALQVVNARDHGWSWQRIATLLGVSKQAVHQKHGLRSRRGQTGG